MSHEIAFSQMKKEELLRLASLENAYDARTLTAAEHAERHVLLRAYHAHTVAKREQAEQDAQALDLLQSYLSEHADRTVERMSCGPLGYTVSIRREDGRLAQSITQRTLASAIRTVIMIARYP